MATIKMQLARHRFQHAKAQPATPGGFLASGPRVADMRQPGPFLAPPAAPVGELAPPAAPDAADGEPRDGA